ncbi:MAG: hypothetical protein J0M04_10060 [Verrucomicrobia bacterium]|nr:hypothetical protein [Verrucomicrobiota bacterium]
MSKDSIRFCQDHQDEAWLDLSSELRKQAICLMVGSGVSAGFGLPCWSVLAYRVANRVNEELNLCGTDQIPVDDLLKGVTTETLLRRMLRSRTRLNNNDLFDRIVAECLYCDMIDPSDPNMSGPSVINTSATLRSLGLMVSGSKRGRISEIVSFNFDCIFEWYLMQHGFVVASYRSWPSEYIDADVRLYHPHGYAPFPWSFDYGVRSEVLAFDEDTVHRVAVDPSNNWKHLYRYLFCTRKIFAVGLSGKDPIVNLMVREASIIRDLAGEDAAPIGYWCQRLPKGAADDEYTVEEWEDWKASLNSAGMVLLEYSEHTDLAAKLVDVVKNAAGDMQQGG